jgi:hypothetical protein
MSDLLAFFERAGAGFGRLAHSIGERPMHDPTPGTD